MCTLSRGRNLQLRTLPISNSYPRCTFYVQVHPLTKPTNRTPAPTPLHLCLQTSCGLNEEEVDPAAEEWAARLAAQREGKAYVPSGPACTAVALGGAASAQGGGSVPSFAPGAAVAKAALVAPVAEEDFDGFDGFGADEGGGKAAGEWDERTREWTRQEQQQGSSGAAAGASGAGWGTSGAADFDVGTLETVRLAPYIYIYMCVCITCAT